MSVLSILNMIASEDKTSVKEAITNNHSNVDELRRAFKFAYNKQLKFGVKAKTFPVIGAAAFKNVTSLKDSLDFLEQYLMTRKLTGSAAIEELTKVLINGTSDDYEVVRRVMFRDLEIGIGQTIANKVWDKLCPKQPQMLASAEDDELAMKILRRGHALAEMKADGARCFTDINAEDDIISKSSRSGNEYQKLDLLDEAIRSTNFGNWVVDGELVYRGDTSGEAYVPTEDENGVIVEESADVQQRKIGNGIVNKSLKGSITKEQADNIVYQVWDIVPRDVYYGDRACPKELTQEKRREYLEMFVSQVQGAGFTNIELIEQTPVKTLAEAKAVYAKYVQMGYEGIILKCGLNLWKNTRSKDLVKFKEKIRIDLYIVGHYPHKKDPNKLGGITVRSACGRIQTNCGSGFSNTDTKKVKGSKEKVAIPMSERDEFDRGLLYTQEWKDKLIGMVVEIECNGLIDSKARKEGESEFKLFLPIFKGFRIDKLEANRLEEAFNRD